MCGFGREVIKYHPYSHNWCSFILRTARTLYPEKVTSWLTRITVLRSSALRRRRRRLVDASEISASKEVVEQIEPSRTINTNRMIGLQKGLLTVIEHMKANGTDRRTYSRHIVEGLEVPAKKLRTYLLTELMAIRKINMGDFRDCQTH